ncbi:hypothetical protein JCM8097_002556 [Rhodosporidiobolus ruineniae]
MLDCQLDSTGNPNPKRQMPGPPRIIGCREHYEIQKVRAMEKTGPDNWVVRKFAVGIVVAIFGYSYYVYVVRLCIPMIRMQDNRLGGRSQGLAYLVIFHVLFVMFVWTYLVAVTTPPGYAKDYVPQTEPPPEEAHYITVAGPPFHKQPRSPRQYISEDDLRGTAGEDHEDEDAVEMVERRQSLVSQRAEEDETAETAPAAAELAPVWGGAGGAGQSGSPPTTFPPASPTPGDTAASSDLAHDRDRCQSSASTAVASSTAHAPSVAFPPKAHLLTSSSAPRDHPSFPPATSTIFNPTLTHRPSRSSGHAPSYLNFPEPDEDYEPVKPLKAERVPQRVPVLTPQYRYDTREGLLRPFRSHRCRHCAAVVLKMDHHCPWVGTCVGARNYKYFYNFLQYSSTYCLFVFLTLLIAQTLPLGTFDPLARPYPGVDGQQIAIIAISFLFFLFTGSLFAAHTRLILRNMTTIEEIGMNRMKQRERAALGAVFKFWQWREKRATRKAWDRQWGRHGLEGNLWWMGSKRANWEAVMGKHKLPWFLPIPARPTPDDGLHYPPNPRFSTEGFWRPRKDWPKELREL